MARLTICVLIVGLVLGVTCEELFLPFSAETGGINASDPAGEPIPELGIPVSVEIVSTSSVDADAFIQFFVGNVVVHRTEVRVPAGATLPLIGPDLATRLLMQAVYSSGENAPSLNLLAGEGFEPDDIVQYIIPDPGEQITDDCPDDPDKLAPGLCGCGVPDTDSDGDTIPDCLDACPNDPVKTAPGICGCGTPDADSDGDTVADCLDECPADPDKILLGACGCGSPDTDTDQDGAADCIDLCPRDPAKIAPGACGCGVSDADNNGNGIPDCNDASPPPQPRACCFPDGSCSELTSSQCSQYGGDSQGSGVTCETAACEPQTQACCLDDDICEDLTLSECNSQEGNAQGAGTSCSDTPDPCSPQTVACCFSDGTCSNLFNTDCSYFGGSSQGPGSDCATTSCPPPLQACCYIDGTCSDVEPMICYDSGGISQGADSTCYTASCPVFTEACCFSDGVCEDLDVYLCYSQSGEPQGTATTCQTVICSLLLPAGVLVVDDDALPGGDGESWATAFQSLQSALFKASQPQPGAVWDEIWVAGGTYTPDDTTGNRNVSFVLLPSVRIYGGFAGNETQRDDRDFLTNPTILSGEINTSENYDNSYNVVSVDSAATGPDSLDGFTIEGGYAPNDGAPGTGAGLYIPGGSPELRNLVIRNNYANTGGGGVYVGSSAGAPQFRNCLLETNSTGSSGGGMLAEAPGLIIDACQFKGNSASQGGGLYVLGSSGSVINSIFVLNTASEAGALYNNLGDLVVLNSTFATNQAILAAGGIHNGISSNIDVINSILWSNSDESGTTEDAQIFDANGTGASVSFSCVRGLSRYAPPYFLGNIGRDPLFVTSPTPDRPAGVPEQVGDQYGDLRLRTGSPCIDAGDNQAVLPFMTTDLAGTQRLQDDPDTPDTGRGTSPIVDMGAYEGTVQP